ncbi:MAG: YggT family protein [Chloroflexi bacterium]|jgi:YggT family protein|nr:MAG: YggT family protein [Chloroflexota bacterium]
MWGMSFIATLLIYALYLFIIVMIIRAVFSWVSPVPTNPVSRFAWQVTEPVLAPVRRWIPPVSGIDLSFIVVILIAYFLIAALRNF